MADVIRIPILFEEDSSGLAKSVQEIEKVKKATVELQSTQKAAFEGGAKDVKAFGETLESAGGEMADFSATTKDAGKSGEAFKGMVRENIRGLTLFGVNLGSIIDGLKAKKAALVGVVSGLGKMTGALRVLKIALISTGIGALVVLIGSLIAFLTKTIEGTSKMSQAFAGLGAAVDVVKNRFVTVGKSVFDFVANLEQTNPRLNILVKSLGLTAKAFLELSTGIIFVKKLFPGLTADMEKAVIQAIKFEAALQKIDDAERELAVSASARRVAIEKNKELADDENIALSKRIGFYGEASKEVKALSDAEIALEEKRLAIIKGKNAEKGLIIDPEQIREEAEQTIKVNNLKADASRQERLDKNKIQALIRQQIRLTEKLAEEEKKRNEQRLKIEQEQRQVFFDLQKSLAQQLNDEEQLADTEQARLAFQRDNAIEALNQAEAELVARAKFLGQEEEIGKIQLDFARLRALTVERYEREITKVTEEEIKKRDDALEASLDEIATEIKAKRDNRVAFLEKEREIDELRIDQITKSGNDELTIEQFKEDAKLRLFKNFLEKKRQTLIDNPLGLGFDDLEIEKLGLEIAAVEDKLGELEMLSIFDRVKTKFLNLFDINEEEAKIIGDQLQSALGSVFDGLGTLYDAQIEQQQRVIDKRQEAVDRLARQLDDELKLKEEGVANNSDLVRKELAEQTEILRAEEEKRLALEKKASRLRLIQNGLEIASNIVLSVAEALKANAKFGLVGIVTGIAQIASIFALIAKAKAQATQFSKLREGAKLQGATHEQGGVDLLVSGASGGRQLYEAEKDEWLIGTKPSREHDMFLDRLNDNEFTGRNLNRDVDFSNDFFGDPKGMLTSLAPKFGMVAIPDVFGKMLPRIRETVKQSHVAKQEREREMIAEVVQGAFAKMGIGLENVERAIKEQPLAIPITEQGYLIKQTRGNVTTSSLHEPPKRRAKA